MIRFKLVHCRVYYILILLCLEVNIRTNAMPTVNINDDKSYIMNDDIQDEVNQANGKSQTKVHGTIVNVSLLSDSKQAIRLFQRLITNFERLYDDSSHVVHDHISSTSKNLHLDQYNNDEPFNHTNQDVNKLNDTSNQNYMNDVKLEKNKNQVNQVKANGKELKDELMESPNSTQKPQEVISKNNGSIDFEESDLVSQKQKLQEVANTDLSHNNLANQQYKDLANQPDKDLANQQYKDLSNQQYKDLTNQQYSDLAYQQDKDLANQQYKDLTNQQDKDLANEQYRDLANKQYKDLANQQYKDLANEQYKDLANQQYRDFANIQYKNLANQKDKDLANQQYRDFANQKYIYFENQLDKNHVNQQYKDLANQQDKDLANQQYKDIANQQDKDLVNQQDKELANQQYRDLGNEQYKDLANQQDKDLAHQQEKDNANQQYKDLVNQQEKDLANQQYKDLVNQQDKDLANQKYKDLAQNSQQQLDVENIVNYRGSAQKNENKQFTNQQIQNYEYLNKKQQKCQEEKLLNQFGDDQAVLRDSQLIPNDHVNNVVPQKQDSNQFSTSEQVHDIQDLYNQQQNFDSLQNSDSALPSSNKNQTMPYLIQNSEDRDDSKKPLSSYTKVQKPINASAISRISTVPKQEFNDVTNTSSEDLHKMENGNKNYRTLNQISPLADSKLKENITKEEIIKKNEDKQKQLDLQADNELKDAPVSKKNSQLGQNNKKQSQNITGNKTKHHQKLSNIVKKLAFLTNNYKKRNKNVQKKRYKKVNKKRGRNVNKKKHKHNLIPKRAESPYDKEKNDPDSACHALCIEASTFPTVLESGSSSMALNAQNQIPLQLNSTNGCRNGSMAVTVRVKVHEVNDRKLSKDFNNYLKMKNAQKRKKKKQEKIV